MFAIGGKVTSFDGFDPFVRLKYPHKKISLQNVCFRPENFG
ncbi:hypothetical protein D3OALGA1CA_5402 [Olavius algarvensis associated proteobacterium Delta 3]|nr:hypothetical protein D3OALGB2SA_1548 [Olavius algarvensis associated proteobacterium Delta 3]CAB5166191.1 hypothetical protein D3OALGA1CA_5402 [Olavius algarvensis associated proteobacterium Delta 3]